MNEEAPDNPESVDTGPDKEGDTGSHVEMTRLLDGHNTGKYYMQELCYIIYSLTPNVTSHCPSGLNPDTLTVRQGHASEEMGRRYSGHSVAYWTGDIHGPSGSGMVHRNEQGSDDVGTGRELVVQSTPQGDK